MTQPARRPAITSRDLSLAYSVLLVVVALAGSGWAPWTAAAGLGSIGLGLTRSSRRLVSVGFGAFALAALLLALAGGTVESVLLATLLAVLAWDAGQRAIDVGAQVGRDGGTTRLELVHAGSSAVVGVGAAAVVYSAYAVTGAAQPFSTAALLLVAVTGVTVWLTW